MELSAKANSAWLDDQTLLCRRGLGHQTVDVTTAQVGPVVSFEEIKGRIGDLLLYTRGQGPIQGLAVDGTPSAPWLDVISADDDVVLVKDIFPGSA